MRSAPRGFFEEPPVRGLLWIVGNAEAGQAEEFVLPS